MRPREIDLIISMIQYLQKWGFKDVSHMTLKKYIIIQYNIIIAKVYVKAKASRYQMKC